MLLLYAIVQTRSSGWQKPMSVRDPGAFIVRWAALAATVRRCGSITLTSAVWRKQWSCSEGADARAPLWVAYTPSLLRVYVLAVRVPAGFFSWFFSPERMQMVSVGT